MIKTTILNFELAPKNPSINGLYYDESSYQHALNEYIKSNGNVFDRYDEDIYYESSVQHVVGKIIEQRLDDTLSIELADRLQFITPDEYVIGFKFEVSETVYDKSIKNDKLIIDKILYATIINKDSIKTKRKRND